MDSMLGSISISALIALIAHWLMLWLGLYLLGRRPHSAATILAGLAWVAGSTYLLAVAWYSLPTTAAAVIARERWLAGWAIFTPALLFHAFLNMTAARLPGRRWVLGFAYALAAAIFVGGFFNNVFNDFEAVKLNSRGFAVGNIPPGRFYWLMYSYFLFTPALILFVMARHRLTSPNLPAAIRRDLLQLILGAAVLVLVGACIAVTDTLAEPPSQTFFLPAVAVGVLLVAAPSVSYPVRLDGQLLRADVRVSLVTTVLALAVFLTVVQGLQAPGRAVAGLGWLVVAFAVLGDYLRAGAEVFFYPPDKKEVRQALRTATVYAGSLDRLRPDLLSAAHVERLIELLRDIERSGLDAQSPADRANPWLAVLEIEEHAPVRRALGLPPGWVASDGVSLEQIRRHAVKRFAPRERQVLGLWYLGKTAQQIAKFMGIRPSTVTTYLSEAKARLDLKDRSAQKLYIHFSGFATHDGLPLIASREPSAPNWTAGIRGSEPGVDEA